MAEAYCGPAPEPQTLVTAWNFDVVAMALALGAVVLFIRNPAPSARLPFALSVGLFLALFISPFCALTVALFSARVAHHVLLVAVVAPLLAMAFPLAAMVRPKISLQLLVALHALVLWFWHAPPVYEVAIVGALPYWAMQLSLLGSAFLLWQRIHAADANPGSALLALLATVVQMGMLGALLTFAREPLYSPHFATTLPFGLTPHADQQLSGLIMWVPAALPYLLAATLLVAGRFDRAQKPARR
jgi:putative membrane protein